MQVRVVDAGHEHPPAEVDHLGVARPISGRTSATVPTAAIRPSRTATASASGPAIVTTRPPSRTVPAAFMRGL